MHAALRRQGEAVGRCRVERLMRDNAIQAVSAACTDAPRTGRFYSSIDNQVHELQVDRPDQVWVGDVTYLKVAGRRYLATIMDRYLAALAGLVTGLGKECGVDLTCVGLGHSPSQPKPGTLFHSDRGWSSSPTTSSACSRSRD
ncbi:MAG: IS3 family transposase [Xanthomonadales bacterium]|nr:IS3 family transposase [Xanthomonadales bacterium]